MHRSLNCSYVISIVSNISLIFISQHVSDELLNFVKNTGVLYAKTSVSSDKTASLYLHNIIEHMFFQLLIQHLRMECPIYRINLLLF